MLLIGLSSLLMAIGLVSTRVTNPLDSSTKSLVSSAITPTLLTRVTSIILLFSAVLSFNALYVQAIGSGLGLYSGLFHVTSVTQAMEIFMFIMGALILLPWAREKSDTNYGTMTPSIPEYPLMVLFTTIGASFLISSSDLVSMYLSIELQSFAVYILAAIYRNSESATSAGLKYFLLGALSSALILLGSSMIYAYTGLTSFESIYMMTNVLDPELNTGSSDVVQGDNAVVLGLLMIGVGFLFKLAAAPFHNWAPDVYDGVPTIVTTWLTVMPKISIFIFLLEVGGLNSLGSGLNLGMESIDTMNLWKNLLLTTSVLSLIIGTVVGLAQYRLKRLLAFSTISHVGFLLLALSVNSEDSINSFLFYLMQYSITNLDAFFIVLAFGYMIHNASIGNQRSRSQGADVSFIEQLKGQFLVNPVLGLSLALCLFSMAGIPPLVGFFAKYMVLYSAIENGYYFLAFIGILASVISAAYYLRIIRVVFMATDSAFSISPEMDAERSSSTVNTSETSLVLSSTHSYIIAVLTLVVAFFILSPSLFLNSSNLLALSLYTA